MNALKSGAFGFPLLLLLSLFSKTAMGTESTPGTLESVYGPEIERRTFSPEALSGAKDFAGGKGYNLNDVNDIKRAATDPQDQTRRKTALTLLTYRMRGEAKGMLRTALADPYVSVRCRAAELLGILGDPNGLASMRRDFAELTKKPADTNDGSPSWEELRRNDFWGKSPNLRLESALQVATVLAEFGDTTGYKLASQVALQKEATTLRLDAGVVLAELGKLPDAVLKAGNCDPEAVLIALVERETEPRDLRLLSGAVATKMKTKPASVVKILEKMEQSPVSDEQTLRTIRNLIAGAKRRLAAEAGTSNGKR